MTNLWERKGKFAATILVTLLPIAAGLILWGQLPAEMPTHFGPDGQADGWSSRTWAVFGLPLVLAAIQALCLVMMAADPKRRNVNGKLFGVAIWVCPLVSLLVAALMYSTALGADPDVNLIITLFLGVLLLVVGNYLPKCRPNYTMGIKLPWTLHDEANWTYTHRLAGKVWTVGAVVVLLTAFLRNIWILIAVIVVLVLVPAVASYLYYRRYA